MAWQLARRQSYRKPVVYREKSLEKTGLHYKNEADSVKQIWFLDDGIKNICKKLVLSMKKRVALILQAKGGHINY